MKDLFIQKYQKQMLNIYEKSFLKNCDYDYVVVLNDQKEEVIDRILYTNYTDFYKKDLLKYPIPPIRKPHKLLTYHEGMKILNDVSYGALSITHDIPYCVSLNHFVVDGHIYFHCGKQGYKLNGLNRLACYHVVKDLGIHEEVWTHNHESVTVYGFLREVNENKKALLNAFMKRYTPDHFKNINDQVINNTVILELSIEHMSAKRHYH